MILRLVLSFCILCFITDNSWARPDTESAQSSLQESIEPCKDGEVDHETHARFLRSYSEESVDTTTQTDRALSKEQDRMDDDMLADAGEIGRTGPYKREMDIITNESKTKVIKIPDTYLTKGSAYRFSSKRRDCYESITIKRIIVGILEHVSQNPQDIDTLINQIRAEIDTETELAWFNKRLQPNNMKPIFSQFKNNPKYGEYVDYSTCTGTFAKLAETAANAYQKLEDYPLCLQAVFGNDEPELVEETSNDTDADVNVIIASILDQIEKYLQPTSESRPITIKESNLNVFPQFTVDQQVSTVKPSGVRPLPEPLTEMKHLNIKPQVTSSQEISQYPQYPSMSTIKQIIALQNQKLQTEQPYIPEVPYIPQEFSTPDYVSDEPDYLASPQQHQKPQYPLYPRPQHEYTPSPQYVQEQPEYKPSPYPVPQYSPQEPEYELSPQQVPQYPEQDPEYESSPQQVPQYPQPEPEYNSAPQQLPQYPHKQPEYNPTPQYQDGPQNQVTTDFYPMPDIQYEEPESQIYEITNAVQSQAKPYKPHPTISYPHQVYPEVYDDQKEPVYIQPTQEIYVEQIEEQSQPSYYDTKDIIVETNPLYPTPTPAYPKLYPEPNPSYVSPTYPTPTPAYPELYPAPNPTYGAPIYQTPKPAYVEPVYPETNLIYPSPTPMYPDSQPTYPAPKPGYPETTLVYDELTPTYVDNQPIYIESQSVYSKPVYIEPTPLYAEPTPEIYSDIIIPQSQPDDIPSNSNIVNVLLQLISGQTTPTNINSTVKLLKENRLKFKPRLYKILLALLNGYNTGKIDADEFNETFHFLLRPQKNKIWDDEKRQLLPYLLLPDVEGQVDLDNLDVISPLIHAQDASSLNILDEILPILKAIQEGHADQRAIEVILTILNQNLNRILRPDQITTLLSLIKPNKKGQVPVKHVDVATPLVNWDSIPYLNPEYVNVIFQLLRPNLNGVTDPRAVEIIHQILTPKKSNFLTPRDINNIFSFLRPESGSIDSKRLDIVLMILNNLPKAPRIIDNLIKILPQTNTNSKYVDVLLSLQSGQLLNTQLLDSIVNLLKQERLGVVDQQIIDHLLSLLEPYKSTHPKIVMDIYNLLRPNLKPTNLNTEPNNVQVLLYQLMNSGIKSIGQIEIPEIKKVQYVMPNAALSAENVSGNTKLNLLSNILQMLQWEQNRELSSETLANSYGFIELTYMLKNQKPFLYQPIYYVKYKIPMISFLSGAKTLISKKPQLSADPAKLLQELIIDGNVSEISPNLQGFRKEDILKLTFKDGDLVQAKVLDEKALTLNEQIKLIHNLNTDVSAQDILQQNQKNAAKYYSGEAANSLENLAANFVPLRGMLDAVTNVAGNLSPATKLDLSNEFDASLGYSPTHYSLRRRNTTPYARSGDEDTADTRQPQNTTSKE